MILKLNLKEQEDLFYIGTVKFHSGDYKGASQIFLVLNQINCFNAKYCKSLASCYQQQQNYVKAASLYKKAYLIDLTNEIDCLFYSACCNLENKDYEIAKDALVDFLEQVDDTNKWYLRAKAYLETLCNSYKEK